MEDQSTNWRQVRLFAILTVLITVAGYSLLAVTGETNIFLLAAPGLSVIATKLLLQRNLSGLLFKLPPWRWFPIAYLTPICLSGLAFVSYWLVVGGFATNGETPVLTSFLTAAGPAFATLTIFAFGEELGWRGFLVPELAKSYRFSTVAIGTGVIWAIWHWPLILLSSNITGLNLVSPWFVIPAFTIILTGAGTILALVTLRSKSVWPATIFHGSQNAFLHGFFLNVTEQTATSPYFVSEAGGLLAVTWGLTAVVVLMHERGVRRASASQE